MGYNINFKNKKVRQNNKIVKKFFLLIFDFIFIAISTSSDGCSKCRVYMYG